MIRTVFRSVVAPDRLVTRSIPVLSRTQHAQVRCFAAVDDTQAAKIEAKDRQLRSQHASLSISSDEISFDLVRRKRIIYRSKQRGLLEVDLILGSWASEYVMGLSLSELDDYERFLEEETLDIFNIVTKKSQSPAHLCCSTVIPKIQAYALVMNMQSPDSYAEMKKKGNLT